MGNQIKVWSAVTRTTHIHLPVVSVDFCNFKLSTEIDSDLWESLSVILLEIFFAEKSLASKKMHYHFVFD